MPDPVDMKLSEFPIVTSLLGGDYLELIRGEGAGANKRISGTSLLLAALLKANNLSDLASAAAARTNLGLGLMSQQGTTINFDLTVNGVVNGTAFVGDGSGLTGIGTGTGGIINTGSTTIGGDSDANGVGVVAIQTRGITRLQVENNGTLSASGTKLTLGDSAVPASARIDLTTCPTNTATAGRLFSWWSQTFALAGGPGGEPNYDDDEQQRSYNRTTSGAKLVAGIKDYAWVDESRFYADGFQSEHYFEYRNPAGTLQWRPWALYINESTSGATHFLSGAISFARNPPNQATQTALWGEEGTLRFLTSAGAVVFANNVSGLKGVNAAGDNTIPIASVNASNKVVIDPGGNGLVLNAPLTALAGDLSFINKLKGGLSSNSYIQDSGSNTLEVYNNGVVTLQTAPGAVKVAGALYLTDGGFKLVEVGAADSGGTGFKTLRVAN